ncbi:choloylglycine hydrolase family protein [Polynucleobacter paneuropaeus]|uniref:linear amide C-N hydrolase n=1 Tax=Polynucleobacter paneuropaeus TaxID=2527775 RepID=UPI001BFD0419|nr:choloylglycine hydrolase family protein [Polynucleobacter paneuropaeus]MBT8514951.1 choloylglycine hydrolase family protein [Polynucleobacter paneuropaeus]MBT8592699.1 choloylglycine hydrolase family protein [Polynucleobacter paneuropaeus]MBT8631334.1 choloylglycine hydrolase family protein [Polynucleobacter paneuropaeus]MBT8632644.1 choloylglycine hydrolase family protein [Polynucleobacter paneuropaeus]QWD01844.1 choloylglycine hydrolase family protein [Polynucleobacter paneuropaeus]
MIKKIFTIALAGTFALGPLAGNACTSFLLKGNDGGFVYGRTMEFGLPLKSQLTVIPRNFQAQGVGVDSKPGTGLNWTTKYAAVGMNGLGLPVLVDGMNEKGLVGGLLNAPNTAEYQKVSPVDSSNSIASVQILMYALTNFATVGEVKLGFEKIKVNRSIIPAFHNQSAPVRMTLHDATGKSIVIEYLKGELVITDNPVTVMTNDPAFRDQLNNIGSYANLTPVEKDPMVINGATYVPPSSGSGLHGLPGDYLSPSRFIRALFLSKSAPTNVSTDQQTHTAWHILGSFDIPPGAISLPASNAYGGGAGGIEITEWTVVADNKNMMYYVKMFETTNVQSFDMKKIDFNAKDVKYYDLNKPQSYISIN